MNTCTKVHQTVLSVGLQQLVYEQVRSMYPHAEAGSAQRPIPLLVALPTGIHPYCRAWGYYDHAAVAIVAYQQLGGAALAAEHLDARARSGKIVSEIAPTETVALVRHELAHWWQHFVKGENGNTNSTNVHRRRSWSEACYLASCQLWPDAALAFEMFLPRRRKLEHLLTDKGLHHWPDSMPILLARLRDEAVPDPHRYVSSKSVVTRICEQVSAEARS